MNQLLKKAAAVAIAGVMSATSLGASSFAANKIESAAVNYDASVSKPTIKIKGSSGVRKIKLSTSTKGATIYYTTDGTTPSSKSKKYVSGTVLSFKKATTIKAIAIKGSSKSSVMTKKVSVTTKLGDVTGDGTISSTDYTRLKSYLAGDTTYICTDNADVDGDKAVTSKDLKLIKQYNNGDISKFPAANSLKTPTVTVYKTYGGKRIEFSSKDSGVSFYYTTNGSEPTNKSTLYVPNKLILDKDTTLKVIAYKSGVKSAVKTKEVTVDKCNSIVCDTPTATNYTKKTDIKLSCSTSSSRVYYTLDGTDPRTSYSAKLYNGAITLTKDTVVRAYAEAKGYADSDVATFSFKVKCGFTVSGKVWNDTPALTSTPDGIWRTGEDGINGIKVYLCKAGTTNVVASTTTSTINGVAGSYILEAPDEDNYQVLFEYNGQKYRAYNSIVYGGNQATCPSLPAVTIMKSGAYDSSNKLLTTVNSYSGAITNNYFTSTAKTTSSYNRETSEVNLALISNNYGTLTLTMTTTCPDKDTQNKVLSGKDVTYYLTVKNDSPSESLSAATIRVYTSQTLTNVKINGLTPASTSASGGYYCYDIPVSSLPAGSATSITITGTTNGAKDAKVTCCAEVYSYRFADSCYDKSSIPGNIVLGKKTENDEAVSTILTIKDGDVVEKKLTIGEALSGNHVDVGNYVTCKIYIKNGIRGNNDEYIPSPTSGITFTIENDEQVNDTRVITFRITGVEPGSASFRVYLKEDPTQTVKFDLVVNGGAVG